MEKSGKKRETERERERERERKRDDADAGRGRRYRGTRKCSRKDGGDVLLDAAVAGGAHKEGEVPVQEQYIRRHETTREHHDQRTTKKEDGVVGREGDGGGRKTSGGYQERTMKMKKAMKKGEGRERGKRHDVLHFLKSGGGKEKTNCRFSHDIEQFMKTKKKDLPGVCPFPRKECPFGLACRFSESHDGGRGEVPDKDTHAGGCVV